MTRLQKAFPYVMLLLAVLFVIGKTPRNPKLEGGAFNVQGFAHLPSSADGRVKPLDTVARTSLQVISGRTELELPDGRRAPAIHWLLDVIARPQQADDYLIFRIDHPDVLRIIEVHESQRTRYSFNHLFQHQEELIRQVQLASQVPTRERTAFQKHLMELWSHLDLYISIAGMRYPYLVPPDESHPEWRPFDQVVEQTKISGVSHPAAAGFSSLLFHYQGQRPAEFNGALAQYQTLLQSNNPQALGKMGLEVFFNRLSPFYLCTVLYVMVFILASLSFMFRANASPGWARALGSAGFWVLLLTFAIHTFGLATRVYLQGRPPVTNLYSSAVFVGWGAVLIALLMELPFKLSIGTLVSSMVGFATLVVAMNLAEGDTMQMMQAVLDSNFWLATHVVVVTAGYSATYLAGLLGVFYILLGTMTKAITQEVDRVMVKMVYGVICFALLLSFAGTVLGGIWADQSWGRFWGWDPKENGAVLIVLWNALILHARWGGMVRTRGIMVLAVFGNIITSWSWFGTNMLGVGLHSYGSMDPALKWLAMFMMSQLAIMLVGLMPLRAWKSFARDPQPMVKNSAIDSQQSG